MKTNPNHNVHPAVFDPSCQSSEGKGFSQEYLHALTTGITKREYFAAMAMQGIAPMFVDRACNDAGFVAKHAVDMADALIEELNKEVNQ